MLNENAIAALKTQQDFMVFLNPFLSELKKHNRPNHNLEDFSRAMPASPGDAQGYDDGSTCL